MGVAPAMSYSAGAVPAVWGDTPETALVAPAGTVAADSGAPWEGRPRKEHFSKAIAEDRKCHHIKDNAERCGGPKAKGTDYCIGHMRQLGLLATEG